MNDTAQAIHEAIRKAMEEIARTGIAKTHQASLGGASVRYRGIDYPTSCGCPCDLQNPRLVTGRPVLLRHELTAAPRSLRQGTEAVLST